MTNAGWDPARDRAEVWIRVDTMAAGRSFRWTFRQGNPSTKIVARQHVDSVFLAKEWLAMWNSTTGKSMVKGGYSLNGDLLADSSSVFSHTFVLESNDYLEAAVPMMGYDSGYTFLASFRFDSLPPTGNLVRLSGDNDNYSLAMDSTESLPRQARLVWGERFSDTVFGQSAPPSDPNGTSRIDLGTDLPIAVSFAPTQTIAYRLGSPSAPLPPLTMTNKSLAGGHFVEVGGFGRSIGFAGTMSLPRLSRGVMDPNRLALEAFNLQTQPSWIRVDRHGSVTGPSKNP